MVILNQQMNTSATTNTENHFSVRWMGFSPTDYTSPYPDYYICVNNLAETTLTMNIALQIKNQEAYPYYFQVSQNTTPPAGWIVSTYNVGQILNDNTLAFVYSGIKRTKPTSIPDGVLTETVDFAVKAFWDSGYTNLYSQDKANATFHFIDRTASWTQLYYDNFDDGTSQGWTANNNPAVMTDFYRSPQYSYRAWYQYGEAYYQKSFDTTGPFQEAYMIFSARSAVWGTPWIAFNGVTKFRFDVTPTTNTWYQFAVPLPVNQTTQVRLMFNNGGTVGARLDDVYVLAK